MLNTDHEKRLRSWSTGAFPPSGPPERRDDSPVQDILRPPRSTAMAPESKSPFVIEVPAGSRAEEKKSISHPTTLPLVLTSFKEKRKAFRMWHDSTGFYQQEAAIVGYKAGVVHLCSADGILFDVAESELSSEDLRYVRSLGVWRKAQYRVIVCTYRFLPFTEVRDSRLAADYSLVSPAPIPYQIISHTCQQLLRSLLILSQLP